MLTTAPSESFKKQDIRLLCNQIAITVRLQNSLKIGLELYSFGFAICGRQFVLTVFKRALQAFSRAVHVVCRAVQWRMLSY